jgi:hypothetical protein
MKPVKSFSEYTQELNEARKLNEGILDVVKKTLKKIGEFFTGIGSNFLNALILQKKEKPKSITLFPTKADIDILSKNGVSVSATPLSAVKESVDSVEGDSLNEAEVKLEHPDPQVENVGSEELMERLRDHVEGGADVNPLVIWGAPGIGKTATVEMVGKEYFGANARQEKRVIFIDLMTMSPEDFFLPTITGKGEKGEVTSETGSTRVIDILLKSCFYEISEPNGDERANGVDGKGGLLFFDELARANARVQNVCLKIMNERELGNYKLGSKWTVIAACNREGDDDTGTYNFNTTLGNRVDQVNYVPQFDDWKDWATVATGADGKRIVNDEIVNFLRFNSDMFYKLDPDRVAHLGIKPTIFPSPRAWTNASKLLGIRAKRAEAKGKSITDKEVESIVSGQVGKEAAAKYVAFLKLLKKIKPEDIKKVYTDPEKAPIPDKSLAIDEKEPLIAATAFYTKDKKLSKDDMDNFATWVTRFPKTEARLVVLAMTIMKEVHPELKNGKEAEYWSTEIFNKIHDAFPTFSETKKVR